ncbi:ras-responsive element-binding protein 1-like isoform X2 [Ostrinia nubilalis]|uniref:ras-responsive element-binding protein 1-like isoform X2 n=1 Tax=Ostrinia nubilalis TaxID=29057 RepID=UPI0030822133
MTSTDTYQLKWHSHSSHLNGSVASLLRSERFTDVVLCTMDGSQIPAHKFILSSCSVYLSSLFEGQRAVTRMGGMLYVVLPSEISTKALKILVEYMYKGETTVSNEVLDTVLKAGEVLKIRGLWRQTDEAGGDSTPAERTTAPAERTATPTSTASANKPAVAKKADELQPKITVKRDDKLLKTFTPLQNQGGTRPMFIGPPKLVFIKTTEGGTQATLRPGGPKGQTILVAPAPTSSSDVSTLTTVTATTTPATMTVATTTIADDSPDEAPPPRILRRHVAERKYGKKQKTASNTDNEEAKEEDAQDNVSVSSKKSSQSTIETTTEVQIKDEPDWDASSIEEEERSIAEMFQAEMSVKTEPVEEMDIEEESLIYSPLACELCAEVFTVPAAWVRHVQAHARSSEPHSRKRKHRSPSDDTEETMALLRCDLCQKHFPNPGEWVRHIQSTHTESDGAQNKTCSHCKKTFPSNASMLIHMRTHTGERPFVCGLCNKGFNVKSNLLRHLRTLHDQLVSADEPGPSDVKRES